MSPIPGPGGGGGLANLPMTDGQRAAEALMTDTFTAYGPNGTTLSAEGYEVQAYVDEGAVPGKVQTGSQAGKDATTRFMRVGDVERAVLEGGLHIPILAPLPRAGERGVGWEYVCTAVGPQSDPILLGKRFLVVGVPFKSYATARRLDVVEVEAP